MEGGEGKERDFVDIENVPCVDLAVTNQRNKEKAFVMFLVWLAEGKGWATDFVLIWEDRDLIFGAL